MVCVPKEMRRMRKCLLSHGPVCGKVAPRRSEVKLNKRPRAEMLPVHQKQLLMRPKTSCCTEKTPGMKVSGQSVHTHTHTLTQTNKCVSAPAIVRREHVQEHKRDTCRCDSANMHCIKITLPTSQVFGLINILCLFPLPARPASQHANKGINHLTGNLHSRSHNCRFEALMAASSHLNGSSTVAPYGSNYFNMPPSNLTCIN